MLELLAAELGVTPAPGGEDLVAAPAPGSVVADDVFRVPAFDARTGEPRGGGGGGGGGAVWDLRVGRRVRLTGGPCVTRARDVSPRARAVGDEAEALSRPLSRYAGDVGRVP